MKRFITTCILITSLFFRGQDPPEDSLTGIVNEFEFTTSNENSDLKEIIPINETFEEVAKKSNIAYRTMNNLVGVSEGYYAIAGVFNEGKNLRKVINNLGRKGFEAATINNPHNNLNYVYIQYFPLGLEAIDAYLSEFDGRYSEDVWILDVKNSSPLQENASLQEPILEKAQKYDEATATVEDIKTSILNESEESLNKGRTAGLTPIKSFLIEKADTYFNKMWYAEAALVYEEALAKGEKYYSYDVIQKAADAHYFNTDMEKARGWYNLLYEKYGKEMSADNIFKYAHSLKDRKIRQIKAFDAPLRQENEYW